ncbi:MAG: 4'-phosphopantetheinyl transferase superfamily protein [Chitinophagales bacterium]|nr:4'-phosphopantetheinyl transferase superfamily protein [Chitinophagales bacterium]
MSETQQVGIDIEKIDSKIERIKNKFLRDDELQIISTAHATEHKFVYWCAKESLYKWYGRKQLDFKEHLFIEPFEFAVEGKLRGEIRKNDFSVQLEINYLRIENYMMAFVSA